MSMWAEFKKEVDNHEVHLREYGFVTYAFCNKSVQIPDGDSFVYIVDVFVKREARRMGLAKKLVQEVIEIAKQKGRKKVLLSMVPSREGSHNVLTAVLRNGMRLVSAHPDAIFFEKEI